MAFYGSEFVFDGRSCSEFGLMVYDFGTTAQGDVEFTSAGKIIEDRVPSRYDSLFYGIELPDSLEYTLVFGVSPELVDHKNPLDRFDIERIASWLTGHSTMKWLQIVQPDMVDFRYKCVISNLKLLSHASLPWAFSCTVTCDSPFAYTLPRLYEWEVEGELESNFFNRSTYNGYYCPDVVIETSSAGDVSIINLSDNGREFKFTGLPSGAKITIDNLNQVITDDNGTINYYPYFNFKFLRFVRGDNALKITGNCKIRFYCEFPVNIGG